MKRGLVRHHHRCGVHHLESGRVDKPFSGRPPQKHDHINNFILIPYKIAGKISVTIFSQVQGVLGRELFVIYGTKNPWKKPMKVTCEKHRIHKQSLSQTDSRGFP